MSSCVEDMELSGSQMDSPRSGGRGGMGGLGTEVVLGLRGEEEGEGEGEGVMAEGGREEEGI